MEPKILEAKQEYEEGLGSRRWGNWQEYVTKSTDKLDDLTGSEFKELRKTIQGMAPGQAPTSKSCDGAELMVDGRVGSYILKQRIGAGAFGEVWRAHHKDMDQDYAIKFLQGGSIKNRQGLVIDEVRKQLRVRRSAREEFPEWSIHICDVYDVMEGKAAFAMELLEGGDLADHLKDITVEQAVKVARGVARALVCAHRSGMGHYDVKPSNIMFESEGSWEHATVKLCDFGIARANGTNPGHSIGSDSYMPPEAHFGSNESQWEASLDERSDIFSLGIVLYEMLTGELPFGKAGWTPTSPTPVIPPETTAGDTIPESLSGLCQRMISRVPGERPALWRDVGEASESKCVLDVFEEVLSGEAAVHPGEVMGGGGSPEVEEDSEELRERAARAVELGEAGLSLLDGAGVERDHNEGIRMLEEAASLHPDWMGRLALLLLDGSEDREIGQDLIKGRNRLESAAAKAHYWNGVLGARIIDGDGFDPNMMKGLTLMEQAGRHDKEIARDLSFRFRDGRGVGKSDTKARTWRKRFQQLDR